MKNNKKLLILSTQITGGCFYYSDRIISYLPCYKEVVTPQIVCDTYLAKPDWTIKYYGYSNMHRFISLIYCIVKIILGGVIGKYGGILLFGITNWDYWLLRFWKLTGLPSYVVIHDGKMHYGEEDARFQKQLIKIMKMSTHLIFLSEYVKKSIWLNYGISKPSLIVPHGLIDYGRLPHVAKPAKPILLFLGRVSKYKGVELLLDAIKKVPDDLYDSLIIAGKWNYSVGTSYNPNKVRIINKRLSESEILHSIALSDIMVFPYIEATQSGVATLAINYMKPVISTDVGALREQFNDNVANFIKPNAEELADAMIYLLKHPERRIKMQQAMISLRDSYSWKTIAENLANQLEYR